MSRKSILNLAPILNLASVAFTHDVVMAALSFLLALRLRYGSDLMDVWSVDALVQATGLFTAIAAGVFLSLRMYRGLWRYASINDLMTIARAAALVVLLYLPALFVVTRLQFLPRSFLIINWFTLVTLLGGPRFLYRIVKDRRIDLSATGQAEQFRRVPVLLVGAGDGADLFIRSCRRRSAAYHPVGLLARDATSVGRGIHGLPVLGTIDDLAQAVAILKAKGRAPERLVLTESGPSGTALRHLAEEADRLGMSLARLPRAGELMRQTGDRIEVAPVAVEDLLGRPQTVLDRDAMRSLIRGRRVLVTGAGGSIGSELVRQIADCEPASLCLVESSEFALYNIDMELAERHPTMTRAPVLGDVRDRVRISAIFAQHRPELVFHAAALKHVPMVEANKLEGLLTNAIGTRIVADAAVAHNVGLMVLISTDKAVNPSSLMGAAKRAAEVYCQTLDVAQGQRPEGIRPEGIRIVTVRFGNVLGSTGSVVPLFQRQLAAGGPITVTDPRMTRYFMTIREAVELVLQASALRAQQDSYRGRIFVLDMGEPVRILDIARQMIRLAGLRPDEDIKIAFTGLRPGEKLFEEIFHTSEPPLPTERAGVLVAAVRNEEMATANMAFERIEAACRSSSPEKAMAGLHMVVPEYQIDQQTSEKPLPESATP